MDCSHGFTSAELKGGDQNLAPFFMQLINESLIEEMIYVESVELEVIDEIQKDF